MLTSPLQFFPFSASLMKECVDDVYVGVDEEDTDFYKKKHGLTSFTLTDNADDSYDVTSDEEQGTIALILSNIVGSF